MSKGLSSAEKIYIFFCIKNSHVLKTYTTYIIMCHPDHDSPFQKTDSIGCLLIWHVSRNCAALKYFQGRSHRGLDIPELVLSMSMSEYY